MSFERFGSSDIYIYEHVAGYIECCGCTLIQGDDENDWYVKLSTPRAALGHLDAHESAGDTIGQARQRIESEYEDLDAIIEPYIQDPEAAEARRERIRKAMGLDN